MNKNKLSAYQKEWRAKNKDKIVEYYHKTKKTPKARWITKKSHCRTKGLEFDLPEAFFEHIPTTCPQCGKPADENRSATISLDRLDPTLGYVVGNVEWICMSCNMRKRDLTYEELFEFAKRGLERHGKEKT